MRVDVAILGVKVNISNSLKQKFMDDLKWSCFIHVNSKFKYARIYYRSRFMIGALNFVTQSNPIPGQSPKESCLIWACYEHESLGSILDTHIIYTLKIRLNVYTLEYVNMCCPCTLSLILITNPSQQDPPKLLVIKW